MALRRRKSSKKRDERSDDEDFEVLSLDELSSNSSDSSSNHEEREEMTLQNLLHEQLSNSVSAALNDLPQPIVKDTKFHGRTRTRDNSLSYESSFNSRSLVATLNEAVSLQMTDSAVQNEDERYLGATCLEDTEAFTSHNLEDLNAEPERNYAPGYSTSSQNVDSGSANYSASHDENSEESDRFFDSSYSIGAIDARHSSIMANRVQFGHHFNLESLRSLEQSLELTQSITEYSPQITARLKGFWKSEENKRIRLPGNCEKSLEIASLPCVNMVMEADENPKAMSPFEFAKKLKWGTDNAIKKVVIRGLPFHGKSIFGRQLVIYWAEGRCKRFKNFKFVFHLRAKDFDKHEDLWSILLSQATGDCENRKLEYFQAINQQQEHVLIVIDSYDAGHERMAREVRHLLKGNLTHLPGATVVVLSRPEKCTDILGLSEKQFKIQGFGFDQLKSYLKLLGKGAAERVQWMLGEDFKAVESLLFCPFFLHLLSMIAELKAELLALHNITEVFQSFFTEMITLSFPDEKTNKPLIEIDYLKKFGKVCCLAATGTECFRFSENELDQCGIKDVVIHLGLVNSNGHSLGETVKVYNASHPRCIEFIIAMYLVTLIETTRFQTVFPLIMMQTNTQESLLLRFLIGMMPDKIDKISCHLPQAMYQSWTMELITTLGESQCLEVIKRKQLPFPFSQFPDWLKIILKPVYKLVKSDNFTTVGNCPKVFVEDETRQFEADCVRRHLTDLLRLGNCNINHLHFELDPSNKPSVDFVLDLFSAIGRDRPITSVTISASTLSDKIVELVVVLFENVSHVALNIDQWKRDDAGQSFFQSLFQACQREMPEFCVEKFEFFVSLMHTPFILWEVKCLCALLGKCRNLRSLVLPQFVENVSLIKNILQLPLEHLSLKPVYEITQKKIRKSSSEGSIRAAKNDPEFLLFDLGKSLVHLDISNLLMDVRLVHDLVEAVVKPTCKLKSLVMANCLNYNNSMMSLDLTSLVPAEKHWTLLDLSGWKLLMSGDEVGTVETLIIYDAEFSDVAPLDVASKLRVRSLKCNRCHLQNSLGIGDYETISAPGMNLPGTCTNALELSQISSLNVTYSSNEDMRMTAIADEIILWPGLRKWKFSCSAKELVDLCECASFLPLVNYLRELRVSLQPSPSRMDNIAGSYLLDMCRLILKAPGKLEKLKLKFCFDCKNLWNQSNVAEFLDDIEDVFSKGRLMSVQLRQYVAISRTFVNLVNKEIEQRIRSLTKPNAYRVRLLRKPLKKSVRNVTIELLR